MKIVRMLVDDFSVNESRFSIGVKVKDQSTDKHKFSKITIVFVENLQVKEVGIEELLKGAF